MGAKYFVAIATALAFTLAAASSRPAQSQTGSSTGSAAGQTQSGQTQSGQSQSGQGQHTRGFGGFPGGGRGILGTVTQVAPDHYTIKNETGELYTVHFSVNTRILKQPAGRRGAPEGGQGIGSGNAERQPPEPIKPTDIKVGDVITAGGEIDTAAKSVGAVVIFQVDPERAKQMREMQANYGKTWLAGRITTIDGTRITIEGVVDHAPHAIEVDENTSFRQRRDSITLADIKPGEELRAEGAVKGGVFLATVVNASAPRNPGGPMMAAPQQ
jgi:preprotein translocase subunit YajC